MGGVDLRRVNTEDKGVYERRGHTKMQTCEERARSKYLMTLYKIKRVANEHLLLRNKSKYSKHESYTWLRGGLSQLLNRKGFY